MSEELLLLLYPGSEGIIIGEGGLLGEGVLLIGFFPLSSGVFVCCCSGSSPCSGGAVSFGEVVLLGGGSSPSSPGLVSSSSSGRGSPDKLLLVLLSSSSWLGMMSSLSMDSDKSITSGSRWVPNLRSCNVCPAMMYPHCMYNSW